MMEKGLGAHYTFLSPDEKRTTRAPIGGVQWSLSGQLGAGYHLSTRFSLYVEPGVRWFIPSAGQPESIRTDKPFNFYLGAGIRTNF
jgi:hypothetical protein